jgi:hypothetical protein
MAQETLDGLGDHEWYKKTWMIQEMTNDTRNPWMLQETVNGTENPRWFRRQ